MRALLALALLLAAVVPAETQQISQPCNVMATATGAANTAVTATVAAGGAGMFFYVCHIDITVVANAAVTGAAGPAPIFTTTNLSTNLVWWGDNGALTTGQMRPVIALVFSPGALRTAAANTAFTIVTSAGQSTQSVRINVSGYYGL